MDRPDDDALASAPSPSPAVSPVATQNDPLPKQDRSNANLAKEAMDHALEFFSTSSNETIIGVFALLMLGTYIILGRLGLLLIGIALGVILHASLEGTFQDGNNEEPNTPRKRKELALEVSHRLLEWPKRTTSVSVDTGNDGGAIASPEDLSSMDLEYSTFRPATAAALKSLTDAVIKDYVKYWYEPILPSESVFPGSCQRIFTHFILTMSSHLSHKRTEDTFLQFLTNSSSIIIVFLNELAAAFAASGKSSEDAKIIVDQYLKDSPDSSLANVLSEVQQRKKLNMIADDILSNYLDAKAYNCPPVRDFLREVFAGVVLESTVISLARPEFINDWIIYLLEDGESEIMHAIDAGVEGARNQGVAASKTVESTKNLTTESTQEQSNERHSNQTDRATEEALIEAKRLSAMIASQDEQGVTHIQSAQPDQTELHEMIEKGIDPSIETPNDDTKLNLRASADAATPEPLALSVSSEAPAASEAPSKDDGTASLSLHGAQVLVDDDSAATDKGVVKSRPTWDYLLQVEPTSARSTGWMVFRNYSDFQSLHEMIETVSRLNRIQSFSDKFPMLPPWKGRTRQELARDLERYLQEAVKHESLANTDRMRRFLEKEVSSTEASASKSGFSFPSQSAFENMGKGVLGALTNAPKGVAGGGRAMFDGVTGVFGGVGHSRKPTNSTNRQSLHQKNLSNASLDVPSGALPANGLGRVTSSPTGLKADDSSAPSRVSGEEDIHTLVSSPIASSVDPSKEDKAESRASRDTGSDANLTADEQEAWASESTAVPSNGVNALGPTSSQETFQTTKDYQLPSLNTQTGGETDIATESTPQSLQRRRNPITADETQIAVELIFAVINELYTLSSAWNIRRTLLNAAKSYILRPGSPTLETIRDLLQDSMIESHTSDDALGEYLKKLRENSLPTEAELKAWPAPPSEEEKAQLREKARRLFVQRGIPQALTSVMGAAASREALEKIFDSLQVETVARGFVFSLLLQGLRVLTL
ncbi:hypothetical protein N7532_003409 [Penicillium argentinense]|uniref:PXA domain-containing protein n=1 Tax=Penicillium argentinense TaxID=1131581 RepID=A0A9W9FMD7_9EURO|nr:uncharacterized protein N7532_003409 [Penicillium argentinense]KAJ5102880.1 hypothetical protein N7532_003409 [Penicillium argentinense]